MLNVGDTIKVHYTGKYEDGTVFDSTATSEPIMFTIGDEMMIEGFEKACLEMEIGDRKTIKLEAKDAYGDYDEDFIYTVKKDEVFKDQEVKVGDDVQIPTEDSVFTLSVISIYGTLKTEIERIWAKGKNVVFDIELLDIVSKDSDSIDDYGDLQDFESLDDLSDDY